MPLFVRLATLTEKAVGNISNLDKMLGEAKEIMQSEGAELKHAYATLGPYDIIAVIEAPDEATAARVSAKIAAQGNFRAQTLSAVPLAEFVETVTGG